MAQYKVIQDIEAEDKLLGPLTLRQFIYSAIVITILYAGFEIIQTKVWFLVFILVPPLIFFGLLAAPFGHEQSSEIWLLGKVRYMVFSKQRVWDQEGIEHLVTITAPPKIETHYSDGLSNSDVKSRLKTLSSTMDTRGWVIKNQSSPNFATSRAGVGDSDERLLDIQASPNDDMLSIKPASDVLDGSTANPIAADLSVKVAESEQQHRRELLERMQSLSESQKTAQQPEPPQAFVQPKPTVITPSATPPEITTPAEPAKIILKKPARTELAPNQEIYNNQPVKSVTQPLDADIINPVNKRKLSADDASLSVNTESNSGEAGEVVVSLH
jgi:hypothetical protein